MVLLVVTGLVAGLAGVWFGVPGFVFTWFAWVVAAWALTPPELTGTDMNRNPVPQGPREERAMRRFNFARSAKWGLVFPFHAFWPGWPVKAAWLAGLVAGLAAFLVPHRAVPGRPPFALNVVDGLFVLVLVTQAAAARRDSVVLGDRSPGVAVDGLRGLFADASAKLPREAAFGLVTAAGLFGGAVGWWYVAPLLGAPAPLGSFAGPLWGVVGLFTGLGAAAGPAWVSASLTHWRTVVAARREWAPCWTMLKHVNPPQLLDRRTVGPAIVDTFRADGSMGSQSYLRLGEKILQARGTSHRIAVHTVPARDPQGQPIPGSADPLGFLIVSWPNDVAPDLTDPSEDPAVLRLYVESVFAWLGEGWGAGPVLDEMTLLTTPDAAAAWMLTLFSAGSLQWDGLRREGIKGMSGYLGCQVLVDHRDPQANKPTGQAVYAGNLTHDPELSGESPVSADDLEYLHYEDEWNGRWAAALKRDSNPPTPYRSTRSTEKLPNGQEIHRMAFVTRQGVDPREFFNLEAKVAATLSGAPFLTITGWQLNNRAGERHAQAFTVFWSSAAVPGNPDRLPPAPPPGRPERGRRGRVAPPSTDAQRWVLGGIVNDAFKAARLARPEVHKVRCLTDPGSRGHIWALSIRLFDGVTLADVRGASQRLRQQMGSEWLRVESAADGVTIVAGVSPSRATVATKHDSDWLVSLDWEQAWLDSKVSGVGGFTPRLVEVGNLPANQQVQVLDFSLPSGLAVGDVKAATSKLETATGNAFVDVRMHPNGKPDMMRVLVCEVSPLPERVNFDFEAADAADGVVFATGVEGEPIVFDSSSSPHALLAGTTGSGKSVLAQCFLYGFLTAPGGADVYVIDPIKGAADFKFAEPYAKAFAVDTFQAAGVLKTVYAEVVRRKNENAKHGASSYRELPDPPLPIVVMIDEFTSLMGQSPVPKPSDDPEMERERALLIADNAARVEVGVLTGKLAREARSAGVTLLLATQKLTAKMLEVVPGSSDLKQNLAHILLGNASSWDRQSALTRPENAPPLVGHVPKGRGLWESLTSNAVVIQTWFAPQNVMAHELSSRGRVLEESEKVDLSRFTAPALEVDGEVIGPANPVFTGPAEVDEVIELDDLEFSLDDLELDLDDVPPPGEGESQGPDSPVAPAPSLPTAESADPDVVSVGSEVVWDEVDPSPWTPEVSDYGWDEVDAFEAFLAEFGHVGQVTWMDPRLLTPGPDGSLLVDTVQEIADAAGVVFTGPDLPVPTPPSPAPAAANLVDFDFEERPSVPPHTLPATPGDDFDAPAPPPVRDEEDPFA